MERFGEERREFGDAIVDVVAATTLDGVVRFATLPPFVGQRFAVIGAHATANKKGGTDTTSVSSLVLKSKVKG